MKLYRYRVLGNRLSDPVGGADELADSLYTDCFVSVLIRLAVVEPEAALI